MNNATTQQPLSDDELDRLGQFLGEIGVPAMNMESLDGYFAALICGPDMVLPSEYLPAIWGEDFRFDSNKQATEILGLLMRHWGTISSELFRTLKGPNVYMPVLLEDDEGIAQGNDWVLSALEPTSITGRMKDEIFSGGLQHAQNRCGAPKEVQPPVVG
jgi:uncharacterized protein